MSRKQVDAIWLGCSIFFFLMLSVSFLLMPLGGDAPTEEISSYAIVSGIIFWLSILMGSATQYVLAYRRRSWYKINRLRKVRTAQKIGLISFFKNTYAVVADAIAILSLLGLVIAMIVTQGTGYICYVFVSLFVFSFSMHCILNGKIFYYIVNQDKTLQTVEKERSIPSK